MIRITIENDGVIESVECDAYLISTYCEKDDGGLDTATKIEGKMGKGALIMMYMTIKRHILETGGMLTKEQINALDSMVNKHMFD